MQLRRYRAADAADCAGVFHEAIQIGAAGGYSPAQRDAWSAQVPDTESWARRMSGLISWVVDDGGVIGFGSVRTDGYVDLLFVHPDRARQGVAKTLYGAMECWSKDAGLPQMTTQASHLAKPFFLRQGWTVERANTVTKGAVTLDNWLMFKTLKGPVVQG